MKPTVLILTFNSRDSVGKTLAAVGPLSDDIHVIDSGSTDGTIELVESFGATMHMHPFRNYGDQRNWAMDTIPGKYGWQLHLDADEKISDELREEIMRLPEDGPVDGYFLARYMRFMNRRLRHNLAPTWHMRLFRRGMGRCELREYDQHFWCKGTTARLRGEMIDDISMSLSEWTFRHNRWADAEVRELLANAESGRIDGKLSGNIVERKRFYRKLYNGSPLLLRALGLFFFRYVLKGGFLDGMEGLIFCALQTLWFRFLVDAKLYEARHPNGPA